MGPRNFASLTIAFILFAATLAVPIPAAAQSGTNWTILIYLDAEGNLEPASIDNMLEMEGFGTGPNARILVQYERGAEYDTRDGDREGTRRYEIPREGVDTGDGEKLQSMMLADMGELNMGDPNTLVDFLVWGVATAPAHRYMVLIWDHGGAWSGVAFDHTPIEDELSLSEVGSALRQAASRVGIAAWDIVCFDACVMATIEVARAVGSGAKIVIGSEELVPGAGGPYPAIMETLRDSPTVTAEELGGRITHAFAARDMGEKEAAAGGYVEPENAGVERVRAYRLSGGFRAELRVAGLLE